jgi:predicted PurR-regulated permease PerM
VGRNDLRLDLMTDMAWRFCSGEPQRTAASAGTTSLCRVPPDAGESHPEQESRLGQLRERLAESRAALRRDRVPAVPAAVGGGHSNFSRAQVPWALDLAAAWSWRFIVIVAAGLVILKALAMFSVIVLPVIVALLISALTAPLVRVVTDIGVPRAVAALGVVIGGIGVVVLLLTFVSAQVANGASDLADQVVAGLGEVEDWLKTGPLNASESQINDYIQSAQDAITERSKDGEILSQVSEFGTAVGHVVAGFFIVLFSTYFFLSDGDRIWAWLVRLAPRAARERVDSSGRVAWVSLTQFVRATVIVALVDALGIAIVAAILGVPFVLAIGVLVFLGAFVPMIGATIAGTVAILVALVDQGPITALLMLGGVILVQQIEGHILQPFLMGRWVSVHPLAVIVAIGCGVLVAGITGALIAVPLAATVNAVVQHLASFTDVGDEDPEEELEEDLEELGADDPAEHPDLQPEPEDDETPLETS